MKRLLRYMCVLVLVVSCANVKRENVKSDNKKTLDFITKRLDHTLESQPDPTKIPRTLTKDGNLQTNLIMN